MKQIIPFLFLFLLPVIQLFGDEFKILSFEKAASDISAISLDYKRLDVNDEVCAIIKVRSDLKGLRFTASNPVVGEIKWLNGEYWIYLSGGTRQLSIFADGFIKLSYNFPERIEKAKVYILTLSSKTGGIVETGKGTLLITSNPETVKVGLDGFPDLQKQTPCSFENYRVGNYRFTFSRNRYHKFDSIITIEDKLQKQIQIRLTPKWGNLIVFANKVEVDFTINGQTQTGSELRLIGEAKGLDPGNYQLAVLKENHYPQQIEISIAEGDTLIKQIKLLPITTSLLVNTFPEGAEVFIDGNYVGLSPYQAENWIVGSHTIKVSKKRYITEEKEITLLRDEEGELNFELRTHTNISIKSDPSGAEVRINGKYEGKTPMRPKVMSGKNHISIEKEHYQTIEEDLVVKSTDEYQYDLKKKHYTLKVITEPSGAEVKIDGVSKGMSPNEIALPYGNYTLTATMNSYARRNKRLNLESDQTVHWKMNKQLSAYIGASLMYDFGDYDMPRFGADLGWTYKKASRFLTGFGYSYGYTDEMETVYPNVSFRNASSYKDLNLNSLEEEDFILQKAHAAYLRLGLVIYKPFVTIHANVGYALFTGHKVYVSDGIYESITDTDLYQGTIFSDVNGKEDMNMPIFGAGLLLPVGELYLSFDYWVSNKLLNSGPEYMLGIGFVFK